MRDYNFMNHVRHKGHKGQFSVLRGPGCREGQAEDDRKKRSQFDERKDGGGGGEEGAKVRNDVRPGAQKTHKIRLLQILTG